MTDSTQRFSDRVAHYVRSRPGYPAEVLDALRDDIGLSPTWGITDVGSGTGISSELFLRNGNPVFAVEPNGAMREAAERLLGNHPHFQSVPGTAEATGLQGDSVDAVVAGQAFHWFDVDDAALRRFFGGRFRHRSFPNEQVFGWEGLRGRLLSSSYTPAEDDPRRAPMLRELRGIWEEHNTEGRVRFAYDTEIYYGRLG